jgi:hypothetical protein
VEKYYLNALIFFLKTQQDLKYKGIERVLRIIEQKRYSDETKRELIIQTFRFYGLNETAFHDGEFGFFPPESSSEQNSKAVGDSIYIVTQTFHIRLLNGVLELAVSIN